MIAKKVGYSRFFLCYTISTNVTPSAYARGDFRYIIPTHTRDNTPLFGTMRGMREKSKQKLFDENLKLRQQKDSAISTANTRLKTIQKLYVELHERQKRIDKLEILVDNYQMITKSIV